MTAKITIISEFLLKGKHRIEVLILAVFLPLVLFYCLLLSCYNFGFICIGWLSGGSSSV